MIREGLAPKWTPVGLAQRAGRIIRRPADIVFAAQIGYFMWRAPAVLRSSHLSEFLRILRRLPRPHASDPDKSRERILRLRSLCLRLPLFRSRDNCYVRALTLYRFLDAGGRQVRIHFGVEQKHDRSERLRGHAWVSVDGAFFETPPEVRNSRVREIPMPSRDSLV